MQSKNGNEATAINQLAYLSIRTGIRGKQLASPFTEVSKLN